MSKGHVRIVMKPCITPPGWLRDTDVILTEFYMLLSLFVSHVQIRFLLRVRQEGDLDISLSCILLKNISDFEILQKQADHSLAFTTFSFWNVSTLWPKFYQVSTPCSHFHSESHNSGGEMDKSDGFALFSVRVKSISSAHMTHRIWYLTGLHTIKQVRPLLM